jgi:hypothetical protein
VSDTRARPAFGATVSVTDSVTADDDAALAANGALARHRSSAVALPPAPPANASANTSANADSHANGSVAGSVDASANQSTESVSRDQAAAVGLNRSASIPIPPHSHSRAQTATFPLSASPATASAHSTSASKHARHASSSSVGSPSSSAQSPPVLPRALSGLSPDSPIRIVRVNSPTSSSASPSSSTLSSSASPPASLSSGSSPPSLTLGAALAPVSEDATVAFTEEFEVVVDHSQLAVANVESVSARSDSCAGGANGVDGANGDGAVSVQSSGRGRPARPAPPTRAPRSLDHAATSSSASTSSLATASSSTLASQQQQQQQPSFARRPTFDASVYQAATADAASDEGHALRLSVLVDFLLTERIYHHAIALLADLIALPLLERHKRDAASTNAAAKRGSVFASAMALFSGAAESLVGVGLGTATRDGSTAESIRAIAPYMVDISSKKTVNNRPEAPRRIFQICVCQNRCGT